MKVERIEDSSSRIIYNFGSKGAVERKGIIDIADLWAISIVLKQVAGMSEDTILKAASLLDIFRAIRYSKEYVSVEFIGSQVILKTEEDKDNG